MQISCIEIQQVDTLSFMPLTPLAPTTSSAHFPYALRAQLQAFVVHLRKRVGIEKGLDSLFQWINFEDNSSQRTSSVRALMRPVRANSLPLAICRHSINANMMVSTLALRVATSSACKGFHHYNIHTTVDLFIPACISICAQLSMLSLQRCKQCHQ